MEDWSQVKFDRAAREAANREVKKKVRVALQHRAPIDKYTISAGTYGYPGGIAGLYEENQYIALGMFKTSVINAMKRPDGWAAMCQGNNIVAFFDNKVSNR